MKRVWIVLACVAVMIASVMLQKALIATIVGIVVGTPFFLVAFASGGGMAEVRITGGKKPNDPNASIGMGLAAAGIAATAMSNSDYPESFRIFYACCFAIGLLIAVIFAVKKPKEVSIDGDPSETKSNGSEPMTKP